MVRIETPFQIGFTVGDGRLFESFRFASHQLGDTVMEVFTRAVFNAACDGEPSAVALLETVAEVGSKRAEGILLQLIRETMATNGSSDFKANFERVAAANPQLHAAYLNGN